MAPTQNNHYHIAIPYASIIIAAFALILNMIGMYLIRKLDSQRTHQSLIILNLSMIQIPISIGAHIYWISALKHGVWSNRLVSWTIPLWVSTRITIIFVITMLTADRLLAIKYSLRYTVIVPKRLVKLALLAIWISWIAGCSIFKSLKIDTYLHVLRVIAIPVLEGLLLCFILYTYSYIFWRMRKRQKILRYSSANPQQVQHWNKQALRVSTIIIFSYIVLVVLPDFTDSMLDSLIKGEGLEIILLIAYMMDTFYYVALPLIYIFTHREMRRTLMESVVRCCSSKTAMPGNANVIAVTEERVQEAKV